MSGDGKMSKKPDLKPSAEELAHWADQKEVIKSNKALKFVLFLFSIMPRWLVHLIAVPVGLFYYIFPSQPSIFSKRQMLKEIICLHGLTIKGIRPFVNFFI